MNEIVDCRGLSCPQPVILARKAMQSSEVGVVKVLVDSAVSRDNVTRTATSAGWAVDTEDTDDGCLIILKKV